MGLLRDGWELKPEQAVDIARDYVKNLKITKEEGVFDTDEEVKQFFPFGK